MTIRLSPFGARRLRSVSRLFALASLPLALAGCFASGGGNFGVEAAQEAIVNSSPFKTPEFVKGEPTSTSDTGEVGFSIYVPSSQILELIKVYDVNTGFNYQKTFTPIEYNGDEAWNPDENTRKKNRGSYVYWANPVDEQLHSRTLESDPEFNYNPETSRSNFHGADKVVGDGSTTWYTSSITGSGGYDYLNIATAFVNDPFVKVGYIDHDQRHSQIFYMSVGGRSKEQFTSGSATYNGNFYIATRSFSHENASNDTRENIFEPLDNRSEGESGALNTAGTLTLKMNFDTKKVEEGSFDIGRTEYNNRTMHYEVQDGTIEGSSFSGSASGRDDVTRNEEADGALNFKGGFYGDKSTRVAGRFWSTENASNTDFDGRFVGVFAAKTDRDDQDVRALYYAGIMTFDTTDQDNPKINSEVDVPYLPKAGAVQIDGKNYELTNENISGVKLKDFQYVKFGRYEVGPDNAVVGGFYVKGELTDKMPTTGEAYFVGQWTGYGSQTSGKFSPSKPLDAHFIADWANKSLKGGLFNEQDTSNLDTAEVSLQANIQGNKFTGTATVNVRVDTDRNSSNNQRITGSNATVQGGFFGPDANELSGTVHTGDNTFGAVFGAKQIKQD